LLKGCDSAEIIRAIRAVMSGNTCLSPEITNSILAASRKYFQARSQPARALLSAREREVLKWIAEGLSTKEIAARLDLGPKTVETYRRRLMAKLGCSRATELVRYALREGIVALD
jgi:DNA-binding NarL/FixJ family response regulator